MTCKDCLYYEVCPLGLVANGSTGTCLKFKDNADFVQIPKKTIIFVKDKWLILNTESALLGETINKCVKYLIKDASRGDADG
jgi:hypothetical protein